MVERHVRHSNAPEAPPTVVWRGVVYLEYVKVCSVPSIHGSQIQMKRKASFCYLKMKVSSPWCLFSFCFKCSVVDKLMFALLINGISTLFGYASYLQTCKCVHCVVHYEVPRDVRGHRLRLSEAEQGIWPCLGSDVESEALLFNILSPGRMHGASRKSHP